MDVLARDIALRVADAAMLRTEEPRQERVDAQQSLPRQRDEVRVRHVEITLTGQRLELRAEGIENVDVVLVLEVCGPDGTELELQDQLANHSLFRRRPV